MSKWHAVKDELAKQLAVAAREMKEEAAKETDPVKKRDLLAEVARFDDAYYRLHGVENTPKE
jgi:hypothetical protein